MKKIILLLIILGSSMLNAMEQTTEHGHYKGLGLPSEIQALIISLLNESDSLDAAITSIKSISETDKALNKTVYELYGNPIGFRNLVHILAKKFNKTTYDIAQEFGTPVAKNYITLSNQLKNTIMMKPNTVDEFMKKNATMVDVNFSKNNEPSPLILAAKQGDAKLIQLLLEHGANPNIKDKADKTALDYIAELTNKTILRSNMSTTALKQAKKLLEKAMKK